MQEILLHFYFHQIKKKYNVNTPNYAIYCHHQYGPTFGNGHDLHIANYGPQNNGNYTKGMAYPLETINELNKGVQNFTAKIYEVYQIIYPLDQISILLIIKILRKINKV